MSCLQTPEFICIFPTWYVDVQQLCLICVCIVDAMHACTVLDLYQCFCETGVCVLIYSSALSGHYMYQQYWWTMFNSLIGIFVMDLGSPVKTKGRQLLYSNSFNHRTQSIRLWRENQDTEGWGSCQVSTSCFFNT